MENLFLRVLNMSLSAAVVIAVVALVRLLLRSAPKKWRYLLWSAVGFRLCCPVSFKAFFSIFRLRPAALSVDAGPGQLAASPLNLPSAAPVSIPAAVITPAQIQPAPAAVPAAVPTAPLAPVPDPTPFWPTIGIVLWLCGLGVMLALGIIRYVRMKRLLTDAAALEPGVYATDRIRVPFILGLLPPRIYLPAGLELEEQRFVLAHERVHIRRGDHWVKLLAYLLLAVHWFNPAAWAAFFLMSRDMEMSCDERVLRDLCGSAKAYSMTLLRFAEGRQFPTPAPLGFGESDAKSRIKNALRWKRPKLWITLTAIVLCVAAVAACAADPKEPKEESDISALTAGDTVCFIRSEQGICLRGTEKNRSFGEIVDELTLRDFAYNAEDNFLTMADRLLSGQEQLATNMDKDSALLALYGSIPRETDRQYDTEPRIDLRNEEGGFYLLSGLFAGEPFHMTLRYAGQYADLLQSVTLKFWPLEDGEEVYSRIKEVLASQLGNPDKEDAADGITATGWSFSNGALSLQLRGKGDGDQSVILLLSGEVAADTPWTWTSTLKVLDVREAALKSTSSPTEFLLNWEQIRELTALLKAVPKEQVIGGRGIPSLRVLELRDTGYALRFDGGVIELDCSRPRASTADAAPAWEIHDEALYAWLDALWAESPFGQGNDPLGLTMRVKDVTPTGCTLVFTQSGGNLTRELVTGEKFALFKRDAKGVWQDLFADRDVSWLAIGYPIAADGATELETDWGGAFTLEAGQYRIGKEVLDSRGTGDFDTYSIYAEFMIPAGEADDPLGLTMGVEDLAPTGCTLIFTQSGGNVTGSLQTGAAYWLYRWDEDGSWKEVTVEEPLFWYDLAYGINLNGTTKLETHWERPFGPLEDGRYRIGKEVMDFRGGGDYDTYMVYAEFDLPGTAEDAGNPVPNPAPADWQEAYRQLFRAVWENPEYEDYLNGPLQAAGLLDLNGSGIPELILIFPGAGKSHAAAVFTVEEGEVRAFNSACAYGLPLARYAADGAFWANDLPAGRLADDVPAFRYYTENGEGFWLLNSGNAAWPAEVWCDWLRFGPAEDGCLTCQSLLSLSVEGEEDDRGTYTETGWRVNGEPVGSETYHQAEADFLRWKDSLASRPVGADAYLSCREEPGGVPAQFDALLEQWQP